jgi:hypothetical protein
MAFPPRLGKPPLQELVERLEISQPPILPPPYFAQIAPQFDELGVSLRLLPLVTT